MEVFVDDFTDKINEGFKLEFSYNDVTLSPEESLRESPTKIFYW